jgi:ribosomal protein S27AE
MEQPGPELGAVRQESRMCPVCGTERELREHANRLVFKHPIQI